MDQQSVEGAATQVGVGQRIDGRYRIDACIGRGGVAQVFQAFDEREQRSIALKCMMTHRSERTHERLLALFRHEFSILTQVAHPCVVRVHDFGFAGELPYYTMELLAGALLVDAVPLAPDDVVELIRELCEPLAILHSRRWLHRDLSPRNVIRTDTGAIKLIDFGATVSMDDHASPVGTPPFMAPEVLRQEELDARADVFGLGALAYFALTGRHAYPVRSLVELPKAWESLPAHPQRLVPTVPAALNELVMSMLHIDRAGRPRTMGEVLHHLQRGSRVSMTATVEAAKAHLDTPRLVGRDLEMDHLRTLLKAARAGLGATCIIHGPRGMGRTRMLDAIALEARTSGDVVVRVSARAVGAEPLALARAIGDGARRVLGLESTSEQALPASDARAGADDADVSDSRLLANEQSALNSWLREQSERMPIVVLVDDVDVADAPSQGFLAQASLLARQRRLLLAVTMEAEPAHGAALHVLREQAVTIELQPLSELEVEQWVRSVFGDVHNVARLTRWLHSVSEGKPAACMELARNLVDRGIAVLAGGSFRLPDSFEGLSLPGNLRELLHQRLAALPAMARQMLELLAVEVQPFPLPIAEYLDLFARDGGDAVAALSQLTAAQIVTATDRGYALRELDALVWIREQLGDVDRAPLHRKLADSHRVSIDQKNASGLMFACYHLWKAGDLDAADALFGDGSALLRASSGGMAAFTRTDSVVEIYEVLLEHRKGEGRPPPQLFWLRSALLLRASMQRPELARYADETLEALYRDLAMDAWDTLPAELSDRDRLLRCLQIASERFARTPEAERGFAPMLAMRNLAGVTASLSGVYTVRYEPERMWPLYRIVSRFRGLTPAMDVIIDMAEVTAKTLGWGADVRDAQRRIVTTTSQPVAGFDEPTRASLQALYGYYLGLHLASEGHDEALTFAPLLEAEPIYAAMGLQIRRTHALMTGHFREAQRYRRERELLVLQSETSNTHLQMSVLREQQAALLCGDLLEIARYGSAIRERAKTFPGWQPWATLSRAWQHALADGRAQAIADVDAALAGMEPFVHGAFGHLAMLKAELLIASGDYAGALAEATTVLDGATVRGIALDGERRLRTVIALAMVGMGDGQGGSKLLRELLDAAASSPGRQSVVFGILCEAACEVALMTQDETAFAEHMAPLTALYAHHPPLRARYERLQRRARELFASRLRDDSDESGDAIAPDWALRLSTALATQSADNQADYLLALVLSEIEAERGQLYRIDGAGRPLLLASRPRPPDAVLFRQALACVDAFASCDVTATRSMSNLEPADSTGGRYDAVWLYRSNQLEGLAGVLFVPADAPQLKVLTAGFKQALSEQLRMLG